MSALTVTLGADISALKRAMAGATELVGASAKRMAKVSGAGLAGLGKGGAAALQKGFSVAGTAFKASIGAALAGGTAAVGIGTKAVTAAADFEQTKVAFTTMIGDAAKAEQTLAKLRQLGAQTPFEFPDLADAGRKLIAFGESADTVPQTLRRIGDISAGVQAPIGEIAELYGKARVQGRLFAEDINQLTGRGIPIIQELAKQFGKVVQHLAIQPGKFYPQPDCSVAVDREETGTATQIFVCHRNFIVRFMPIPGIFHREILCITKERQQVIEYENGARDRTRT